LSICYDATRKEKYTMNDIKHVIARRAAADLKDGQVINLGIGLPTLVADYVPSGIDVVIHGENGVVGVGPAPAAHCSDPHYANAGGQPITLIPGGSFFDSSMSFGMIRGGHVDVTFLGTLQVDSDGNIASYEIPGKLIAGMGGAMDLLVGARTVYVLTEHCSKDGEPKLVKRCTYPLTGAAEADVVITERALFRRPFGAGFVLEEIAKGYNLDDIAACTELDYVISETIKLEAYGP
jgi:acetate CoA/acetoacetate CoA-transferase beta subunit